MLDLAYNQLADVKGLEKLKQLTALNLERNQLTELPKGLEKLTQLKNLYLKGNKLTEVPKELENLTQLEKLRLDENELTDVKGLEKLTRLKTLWLRDNPALTKAQIAELQKALPKCEIYERVLTKVELREKALTDLNATMHALNEELNAVRLKQLLLPKGSPRYLSVGRKVAFLMRKSSDFALEWEARQMDLEEARREEESAKAIEAAIRKSLKKPTGELTKADLEKVTVLNLNGNQRTSVKGLEKLTQLEYLYLTDNKLTSVKGLEKLTQLIGLTLENNPALTKAQIAELQKALPKCKIYR